MRVLMVTPQLPAPTRPGSMGMAPTARQIESVRALGADVDVLEIRGLRRLKYLQCLPTLHSLARSADLLHAHFGYCGWLARTHLARPVVLSFMGDDLLGTPDYRGRVSTVSKVVVYIDRWIARTVDAVIVKSAEMARVVAPVRAHVIPNGVDLNVFSPLDARDARDRLGLADGKRYVLFPGRPDDPHKGFALAQDVVRQTARDTSEPIELVPLRGVTHDKVPLFMNACDAMVLTSFAEGSPNVVKEAMACNLPIVSVPVGDVSELLAGVSGCAICPRDPAALSRALAQVVREGRRTEGRNALQRKGLDQGSVAQRIMTVYREVLETRRG